MKTKKLRFTWKNVLGLYLHANQDALPGMTIMALMYWTYGDELVYQQFEDRLINRRGCDWRGDFIKALYKNGYAENIGMPILTSKGWRVKPDFVPELVREDD